MPTPSSCPPEDRLRQLLEEALPGADQKQLVAHLDHCVMCQRTLEDLTQAEPALLDAAGALQRNSYTEELPLRRVLNELEGETSLTIPRRPPNRVLWVQSLLQPTDASEGLGRLGNNCVTELLGQGAMGVVLKAFDPALRRWVAIKMLAPDLAGEEIARRRFAREAQAAAAVRHEHIVTIHAVSEAGGVPYFVMEYLAGGSLQEYLDQRGPLDWTAVAQIGVQIASGLAAAHARGLIHRDIKPSNILLEPAENAERPGAAKISDFGLARVADETRLTQTGIITGTPMYMAPEQALCEKLTNRADLFSLGSVLYMLCTGREPFPGGSPMAVLRQVCEARPRPVREWNPTVPDWLARTIERLHAKRPADRFASATEVAELIRYNLAHPNRPRVVARPWRVRWLQRRIPRVAAGALSACLLLTGAVALTDSLHWTNIAKSVWPHHGQDNELPLRAVLRGHDGPVWSVAFAPDGQSLVTGSDDTTVRIWDTATGEPRGELRGHLGAVFSVAFAHSGKFIVSGSSDGPIRLWDALTRKAQAELAHEGGNVRRLSIAPDDTFLAVGSGNQSVELWDLGRRQVRLTIPGHHITFRALAFSPDGQSLATGDAAGGIGLWDPATGVGRARFRGDALSVRALAFTPDSRTLLSAGSGDKEVKLWDTTKQNLVATLSGYDNGILALAVSADGRLLATGSTDGIVKLWNLPTRELLATLHAHQSTVLGVAIAPDGQTLATVGEDRVGKLWDLGRLPDAQP